MPACKAWTHLGRLARPCRSAFHGSRLLHDQDYKKQFCPQLKKTNLESEFLQEGYELCEAGTCTKAGAPQVKHQISRSQKGFQEILLRMGA